MKQLYWDSFLMNKIGSYLYTGENGILNLITKNYFNTIFKLNINGFILDNKMREWFCFNFNFNMNIVNSYWSSEIGYLNCLKYCYQNYDSWDEQWDEETIFCAAFYGHPDCLEYLYEYDCPYNKNDLLDNCDENCLEFIENMI